jgi:maltose alpha-D-glucosyltransferase/alpha-amylase
MAESNTPEAGGRTENLPEIEAESWQGLWRDAEAMSVLGRQVLPGYMSGQRWFGGKARTIDTARVLAAPGRDDEHLGPRLALVEIIYDQTPAEVYVLPLAFAPDGDEPPQGAVARARLGEQRGIVYEAVYSPRFGRELLDFMAGGERKEAGKGVLRGHAHAELIQEAGDAPQAKLLGAEQSNTTLRYGERFVLKLYRRTEWGVHPDVEVVRHLTEQTDYTNFPAYLGHLEYVWEDDSPAVLGLMQRYVPNLGDAWTYTLERVRGFYERVLHDDVQVDYPPAGPLGLMDAAAASPPPPLDRVMDNDILRGAGLLGRRTAELHVALASETADPAFQPGPMDEEAKAALFTAMSSLAQENLSALAERIGSLGGYARVAAQEVLDLKETVLHRMAGITAEDLESSQIRIHGDLHLGQVLYTGDDFVLFDFEGEPARPMSERRAKRSPVRDVAGMLRSFHYAAWNVLLADGQDTPYDAETVNRLAPWAELWYLHVAGAFLSHYMQTIEPADLIPADSGRLERLLVPHLLEKAVYEAGYELNNRPDWLIIPLRGIKTLCGAIT